MIIVVANIIAVAVLLWINPRYVISFEVAFVGAMCVVWSSYRAVMKKVSLVVESSEKNVESTPDFAQNIPKKERFFVGMRLSFGLLRLLSYAFIGISIIALINNGAFYAIPFLAGIALSTLTTTLYALTQQKARNL